MWYIWSAAGWFNKHWDKAPLSKSLLLQSLLRFVYIYTWILYRQEFTWKYIDTCHHLSKSEMRITSTNKVRNKSVKMCQTKKRTWRWLKPPAGILTAEAPLPLSTAPGADPCNTDTRRSTAQLDNIDNQDQSYYQSMVPRCIKVQRIPEHRRPKLSKWNPAACEPSTRFYPFHPIFYPIPSASKGLES